MKRTDNYNTRQKELILSALKKEKKDFTVKNIYDELNGKVGLTTIYRLVDKLVIEERIEKYIDNSRTYYRYFEKCDSDNHFYLKCDKCKNMIHIDCNCINDLSNHIKNEHKFKLKKENIVINGICEKCRSGK